MRVTARSLKDCLSESFLQTDYHSSLLCSCINQQSLLLYFQSNFLGHCTIVTKNYHRHSAVYTQSFSSLLSANSEITSILNQYCSTCNIKT